MTSTRRAVGEGRAQHDVLAADIETSGAAYAARFAGPTGAWMLDVQAHHALGLIAQSTAAHLTVLDVGGGHAQLTRPLLAAGHRVVVHGSALSCHERLRASAAPIAHVTSTLWKLPFADATFDLALGLRLLAHVQSWRELLAELARVSRERVLVDFPRRGALHRLAPALFGVKRQIESNTRPYFDYDFDEVTAAFDELGLEIVGARGQFAWPMVLHRALRRPQLSRALESCATLCGWTEGFGSPVLVLARHRDVDRGLPVDQRRTR